MSNDNRESFINFRTRVCQQGDATVRHDTWHVKNTSKNKFMNKILAEDGPYTCEAIVMATGDYTKNEIEIRRKIIYAIGSMDALKDVDIIWDSKFTISYEIESIPKMKAFRGIVVETNDDNTHRCTGGCLARGVEGGSAKGSGHAP